MGRIFKRVCGLALAFWSSAALAASDEQYVRISELDIEPARFAAYQALLNAEIEASRREPGLVSVSAEVVDGKPAHMRLREVYVSEEAFEAHRRTSHFLQYRADTNGMIKSLDLTVVEPAVALSDADPGVRCALNGGKGAGC